MNYFDEICKSMKWLGSQKDVVFIGQAVAYPGTAMTNTLQGISREKLLELPVAEEMQMGISLGIAMNGQIPISIFPRWNFLLCGMSQLVNHIDKFNEMWRDPRKPKLIIRTGIGSTNPLNPQSQHTGDFTDPIKQLCPNLNVVRLDSASQVFSEYELAYTREDGVSTLLVEVSDNYHSS